MKLQHRDGTVTEQKDSLEKPLSFLYGTVFGRLLLKPLTARWISRLAGSFLSTPLSKGLIQPFIRKNGMDAFLDMEKKKWSCPSCGGVICVHDGVCARRKAAYTHRIPSRA